MAETKYSKSVTVAGTANRYISNDILTSTTEEPKKILGVFFTESTVTENHDAKIAVYDDRDKVSEWHNQHFLLAHDSDNRVHTPYMEINHVLEVGHTFTIGHTSGSTAADFYYTVVYQITS